MIFLWSRILSQHTRKLHISSVISKRHRIPLSSTPSVAVSPAANTAPPPSRGRLFWSSSFQAPPRGSWQGIRRFADALTEGVASLLLPSRYRLRRIPRHLPQEGGRFGVALFSTPSLREAARSYGLGSSLDWSAVNVMRCPTATIFSPNQVSSRLDIFSAVS